jgi:tetraacyldisaccharide 4'-kinase
VSIQSWLNRIWYGRQSPLWWLAPLSLAYAAVVALRRALYRRGWMRTVRLDCPVVVVGNLSVGGTGKTPLVCWLAGRLKELGWKPGIVTRGYGGRVAGVRWGSSRCCSPCAPRCRLRSAATDRPRRGC